MCIAWRCVQLLRISQAKPVEDAGDALPSWCSTPWDCSAPGTQLKLERSHRPCATRNHACARNAAMINDFLPVQLPAAARTARLAYTRLITRRYSGGIGRGPGRG